MLAVGEAALGGIVQDVLSCLVSKTGQGRERLSSAWTCQEDTLLAKGTECVPPRRLRVLMVL